MAYDTSSDLALLQTLGRRLARHRLNRNMTQGELATEAGVSLPTVQRIEYGHSTQTSNLVRVLRALGLVENLDGLVPEPPPSPLQQVKLQGRERKRAKHTRRESTSGEGKPAEPWTWGDDE